MQQMKHDIKYITRILILTGLIISYSLNIAAQEFELSDYKMGFKLSTKKNVDNSRTLEVLYQATNKKDRKDRIPIVEALIEFYASYQDSLVLLGGIKTNNNGIAEYIVPASKAIYVNEEGFQTFTAKFAGSEGLKRQKKSVEVKDLFLELNLAEEDSIKTVYLEAFLKDSIGEKVYVEDVDLVFSVGGMLSRMPIEDGTIEDGRYEFEMPDDIPGDLNGDFKLYAFIDDHDEYGTVLQMSESNWGVFDNIQVPEKNKLWTDAAPIWMYIVLTILLVGAWANYVYAVVKLWRIKKIGM